MTRFGRFFRQTFKKNRSRSQSSGDGKSNSEEFGAPPEEEGESASPFVTWIMNAIRGLPTDEDVRKTYFWECRRLHASEMAIQAESKRSARLKRLWKAQWYSPVEVLTGSSSDSKGSDGNYVRQKAFAIIQGHRFLWWHSESDFDYGEEPAGRIFLAGHSGLATPSPLELRAIENKDEHSKLTSIFGRGLESQKKITIIAPSEKVKEELELAVSFATTSKRD